MSQKQWMKTKYMFLVVNHNIGYCFKLHFLRLKFSSCVYFPFACFVLHTVHLFCLMIYLSFC